jgi:insertion element IS1 protein InsB
LIALKKVLFLPLPARGSRDAATFQRLYDKVKHLTDCIFYTDNWDAFAKVLSAERHVIGKKHVVTVERDNNNTRHHLGQMTRRTKVVSKKDEMVDASMKLWNALTDPEVFQVYQAIFLSVFE